jgi:hypothetical protein
MTENNLESNEIAQNGQALSPVPTELNIETPLLNRLDLEDQFGGYRAPSLPDAQPTYRSQDNVYQDPTILSGGGGGQEGSSLKSLENSLLTSTDTKPGGSIMRTLSEVSSNRYDNFVPGDYNNEDAYAQGQEWPSKMINGVGKGLLLTGTTFLQGTVGLVNGLARWGQDGKFSSFYNNEFNRSLDEINKKAEDVLPNFYTDIEKNASWYSPDYFLTGNFLWDGVVKNMGFSAGAYLTGGVYSAGLKGLANLPGLARLFSMGKAAEAVAASEEALIGLDKGSEAYGKIKALSDSYLKTYNVLDKGHRAVVAGLSTTGEAGFEAYQNLNQFRDKKIQEFKNKNGGLEPTGADLDKINSMADSVGNASFMANVALLSATNYIQFPKILGSSYSAEKGIMNNLTREIGEVTVDAAGKLAAKVPKNKLLNTINKVRPYLFSTSEAFEEGSQFAVQMGTQDYYNKKYNNEATNWLSSATTGVTETLGSDEGMKNVLIGGLSGSLMMARANIQEGMQKSANTAKAIEQINQFQLSDFTKETIDSVNRGTTLQEERETLLKAGNITDSKDKETDYIINYLTPRIKFGRFDLVASDIADQRALASTDEGFNQLVEDGKAVVTDTKEAYVARLNNFEQTANNIKSLYQSLNLRYGGQMSQDGKPLYSSSVIDKMIYAATKVSDYDQRIPSLSSKLTSSAIDINVNQILSDISEGKLDSYNEAIAKINADKTINSDQKEDLTTALDDIGIMSVRRDMLIKEYDAIKKSPENFQAEAQSFEEDQAEVAPKEKIKVETKNGLREVEIGTEYVLGKVTEYTAKGHEVYRQPRLTILGRNEDGTIKIKASNGVIRDITEEELNSYSLTPASKMLTDKKFNYFEKHQNMIFKHYGIKDKNGDPVKGRLEYNDKKGKLTFVYRDDNGVIKKTEVWNTLFKAQEGYAGGMIRPVGILTAVQQKAELEFQNSETTISDKLQTRNRIIRDLYETSVKRLEEINKKLENSKDTLEKEQQRLEEEISKESLTKAGTVRKRPTTTLKKLTNTLANLRNVVEKENNSLKLEKDELEATIPFFKEFLDSLSTLPQNSVTMIKQLKSDINSLEELIDVTNDAIKSSDNLLKQIDDMLQKALSIFDDYLKRLKEDNPNVPLFIEELQANVEKFLGEEGARMFVEDRLGFTEKVLQLESDINDFSDELKIPGLSKTAESLVEDIKDLKEKLNSLVNEQLAKATILETFQKFAEDEKAREAEEQQMRDNEILKKSFLGTLTNSVQNFFGTAPYEALSKKDELAVVAGTKPAKDSIPHQERVNFFGNKLDSFENKDQLRGMIVTANTENDIIAGLTEDFLQDMPEGPKKDKARAEIIYLVMVQDNEDGSFSVVDQNGKPILEDENKIGSAIYQVFPNEDLTSEYEDETYSMFREGVSDEIKESLTAQYAQWRADQLAQVSLGDMQSVSASFGQPKLVTYKNQDGVDEINKGARTSAQAAGLVTQSGLRKNPLVEVATTSESVSEGSVTFTTPTGRVFLRIPGRGLAKLFNRKFSDKEANVIFDVMHQITKNTLRDGEINDSSKELFDWLKSVTYWGIAKYQDGKRKPAGYNNIWFQKDEDGVQKLFMSGLNKDSQKAFEFTPSGLQANKDNIIILLREMYNNTDSMRVNGDSWSTPYYEITGIDSEGNIIDREWPNYQTYLLSDKAPNANREGKLTIAREGKELPLATQFRPITESQPINREGIYFTLDDASSRFERAQPELVAEQPVIEPVAITPSVAKEFNDDNETPNTIVHPTYGNIVFRLDKENNVTLDLEESADAIVELAKKKTAKGMSQQEAENWAGINLLKAVKNKLTIQPEAAPVAPAVKFDSTTPVVIENDLGTIVYTADENGKVTLNLEASADAIVALAATKVGPAMTQKEAENWAGVNLTKSIEKKIASQLVQQQIPNLPPVADEAPVVEASAEVSEEEVAPEVSPEQIEGDVDWNTPAKPKGRKRLFRLAPLNKVENIAPENWKKLEEFFKKVLPNVPLYRVKNMIQATNGREAYGMLHDAAIYVYEGAEIGTAYHEVFEAVWKMFAGPAEKQLIINEFRNREGSYFDAFQGKEIKYAEATNEEIKEQLAEEFREAVLANKLGKPLASKGLIGRLFSQLIDYIKGFFVGRNAQANTKELFDKIGSGYYAQYNPYETKLSYANKGIQDIEFAKGDETSDYRLKIKNIPAKQIHDIIQQMTYSTLSDLAERKKSLFEVTKPKKGELYARLKQDVLENCILAYRDELYADVADGLRTEKEITPTINNLKDLFDKIKEEWPAIVEKHEEHLKSYSIEFDENDDINLTDEDNSGKSDYMDARKIDSFRKANSVIKLLLATLPKTRIVKGEIVPAISTIGGIELMPADQAFITLMNTLHDSVTPNEMFNRLRTMAKSNPNYDVLYRRLTNGSPLDKPLNWDALEQHDLQLLTAFWTAMKKMNADVVTVFVLPSGEVVIGNSVLSGAARQAKREMINNITESIRADKTKYLHYDKRLKKYNPTSFLKAIKFNSGQLGQYVAFLQGMGINFKLADLENKNKVSSDQLKLFRKAVEGIHKSLSELENVSSLTSKTLNIDKRLTQLGTVKAMLDNPDFESTYFNINGERTQSFIGTNAISAIHDVLSKLTNIRQLTDTAKGYSAYKYLLTDKFSKGSVMLSRMFDLSEDGDGGRIFGTEDLMKPVFIDGTVDEQNGNKKESSKLSAKQRLIQEINLNSGGIYLNLVPGDASIEHAIKMHNDDDAFISDETFNKGKHLEIFRDYFISELDLARDKRTVVDGKKSTDLRFFKAILGDALHNKIMAKAGPRKSSEKVYEENKADIDNAVRNFIIREAADTETLLRSYGVINVTAEGVETEGLILGEDETLSQTALENKLKVLSTNYIIANIEMHKLVYSDPYQYSDELKRIKNFNSPRQAMISGSKEVNASFNNRYNKGYESNDIGYTDMNIDHFVSSVIDDVFSTDELEEYLKPYEETDGGGHITLKATRVFLLRTGQWNDSKEKQYRYDIAYEKTVKGEGLTEQEKKEKGLVLTAEEKAFGIKKVTRASGEERYVGKNPNVKSLYTPIKPIVSGNKNDGKDYNDVVLDKFALVPLSFRILHEMNPDSNAIKHYNKMQRENTDYTVYGTGRKVGTGVTTPLYLPSGEYNEASFEETNNIPFSIMGLQTEVPSKDTPLVTQGSQITKLATMDFLEAGMPIDFEIKDAKGNIITDFNERFAQWTTLTTEAQKEKASPLYKEIANNQKLLEAKIEQGYKSLLKKLGIKESINSKGEKVFNIASKDKLIRTLKGEILKREVNDNITDALEGFKEGDVVLEATPAYQQIRNILYSIADKNVVRTKISGGMKVQISSTLFESTRIKGEEFKDKKGNTKYRYSSDLLKFYKNKEGERVCEIMVARWFDNAQTKNMTDKELLDYLNTTDEGKSILAGIGYRIPTQKQNSIDSFVIKEFLPKDFGDSVVIPSALVKKVGSDFDIDKLSIYLKNTYSDAKGKLKAVPFFGYGQEAIDKFKEIAIENNNAEIYKQAKSVNSSKGTYEIFQSIINNTADEYTRNKWLPIIADWFPEQVQDGSLDANEIQNYLFRTIEEKQAKLEKLTDATLTELWAEEQSEIWYKQSLENAYIQSLQNLVSHELNFDNLVKPNSADDMKKLSTDINNEMGNPEIDYGAVGNMLSRGFMSSLRQAFVSGKYAIGIAATGQTNNADNQRSATYIDLDKLNGVDPVDKEILGGNPNSSIFARDPNVNFEEYNSITIDGAVRPTLSMVKNKAGKYISDIIGQFIDGYVDISKGPWIMRLGATPNVTSTWLFLIKLGVPADTVAYFMNQPIVKDYLQSLENKGYTWLFNDRIMGETLDSYEPNITALKSTTVSGIPSEAELFKMLKYNKANLKAEMSDVQKLQQQYILKEFIKYSKMSSQLFDVVQGSNIDTATINDPYLVFKKRLQLIKARKSIISSVDNLLNSSFKGVLKDAIFDIRDAFAEILISDKPNVRTVMEDVLTPYIKLGDRDFVKVSQKAVSDLFDWAVQTNTGVNANVGNILLGKDNKNSAAQQIIDFRDSILGNKNKGISPKPEHALFDNIILNSIKMEPGSREGKANSLYIAGRDNKVYDQNLIIYGFDELRKNLGDENKDLYGKLVRLAVLQSGLTNSPIAFTNLLPYNDFKNIYNETLSNLENIPNLADFQKLHVFERNNWNNSTIMPFVRANMKLGKPNKYDGKVNLYDVDAHFTDGNLKNAMSEGKLPKVIGISPYGSGRNDFITYSWEDPIPYGERVIRKKTGDRSHIHKVLLQKVYTTDDKGNPVPLVQSTESGGRVYTKHIFKAINAWGDSFRAQEFYDYERASVLDNDYEKVERVTDAQGKQIESGEVSDDEIVKIFKNEVPGETSVAQPTKTVSKQVAEEIKPAQPLSKEPKAVINKPKTPSQYKAIDDQNIKDQLVNKDYYFEIGETNKPIKIKKENLERYLKNANNPQWMLLTKGTDDKFYETEMPEPKHNIFLDNSSMEYVSIQDMVEDVTVGDANYQLSPEEKQAAIDYLKQYGIDVSSLSNEKPDSITQEEWDALSQEEKNKIKEC